MPVESSHDGIEQAASRVNPKTRHGRPSLAAGWGGRSASCICAVGLGPGGFPERSQGSSVGGGRTAKGHRREGRRGQGTHACTGQQSMIDRVWSLVPFKHSIANVGPGDSVHVLIFFTMHLSYSSAPVTSYYRPCSSDSYSPTCIQSTAGSSYLFEQGGQGRRASNIQHPASSPCRFLAHAPAGQLAEYHQP